MTETPNALLQDVPTKLFAMTRADFDKLRG